MQCLRGSSRPPVVRDQHFSLFTLRYDASSKRVHQHLRSGTSFSILQRQLIRYAITHHLLHIHTHKQSKQNNLIILLYRKYFAFYNIKKMFLNKN